MVIWYLFSSAAMVVAIVGCATIWGFDRLRAEQVSRDKTRIPSPPPPRLPLATSPGDAVE